MRGVIRLFIFAFMLSGFMVAGEIGAQEDALQLLSLQLVGTWTGVLEGPEATRTLEIKEIQKREVTDGVIFDAKGLYGITGQKLGPITMEVGIVEGVSRLAFVTSAKSRIAVTWTNAGRMDGTFTFAKGEERSFRLWKADRAPVTDPKLIPLLGTWDGLWSSGRITHLRVDFIDATGASITYVAEDFPQMQEKGSWKRRNAKVLEDSTIEFTNYGEFIHRYRLTTFFGKKYLDGVCAQCRWYGQPQTVTWSPSTTFLKIE